MTRRICNVVLNAERHLAPAGELLLDWALTNGVELAHDCRAGICGACRVRLVEGRVFGGHEPDSDMIRACQARIVSDIAIIAEDVPHPVKLSGRVAGIARLAPDIVGVTIELRKPLGFLPGQYCKVQFGGFPSRSYSPTYPLQGAPHDRMLYFHVRMRSGGGVSSVLGRTIRAGHRVKVTGPFGNAFFRKEHDGRIVLVASGTGFAPIWSIAVAAIQERPQRELVLVVAARTIRSLYMDAALCRLALFPNVTIIPVVAELQGISPAIRTGAASDHIPELSAGDMVYAAGAPATTKLAAQMAAKAGVPCHVDPFAVRTEAAELSAASNVHAWLGRPLFNFPRVRNAN